MLARDMANALASALTLSPAWYCRTISDRCAAVVFAGRPSCLTFALRAHQAGLGALHEQIPLHLGDGCQHGEHHLARRRCQVQFSQLQDDHAYLPRCQQLDRGAYVLGVAAEPVELRHDEGFTVSDLAQQRGELWALARAGLAADRVGKPEIDLVPSCFDLDPLVIRGLLLGAHPSVREDCHGADLKVLENTVRTSLHGGKCKP